MNCMRGDIEIGMKNYFYAGKIISFEESKDTWIWKSTTLSLCGWIPLHFAVKCPHYREFSPHIGALQSTQNRGNIPQDTVQRPLFWFLPSHFYHLDAGWNWLSVSENRKKRCRRWILRNFQAIHLQICHFCLCGQPRKTYHKAAISCPFLHFHDLFMALWADFLP